MTQSLAPLTDGAAGCTHIVAPLSHIGSALAGLLSCETSDIGELTSFDGETLAHRLARAEDTGDGPPTAERIPALLTMFEKAVELDPGCARAYAQMAVHHLYSVFVVGTLSEEKTNRAREYVERALSIDNDDSSVHWIASLAYLLLGQHDLAKTHSERAIALNPNDVDAIRQNVFVMGYLGNPHGGLERYRKAQRLDPHEAESNIEDWLDLYYMSRQYDKAIEIFRSWHNPQAHNYANLAACYAQLGRMDESRAAVEQFERARPDTYDFSEKARVGRRMFARQEDADHWMEGYRKAGFDV